MSTLLEGILVLNKPRGLTSHDCVARIRRLASTKKVGHTGTLDPEVTGVLPICIGQATRVAEYLLDYEKEYIADISIGRSTTTQDQTGETVEDCPLDHAPTRDEVEACLASLVGDIEQIPPMYSAVKVGGVRLHELARKGETIDRKARKVTIYLLELLDYTPTLPYPTMKIRVRCSKGTYIRTLGVQIGEGLGKYPAHMSRLIRSQSGPFTLAESHTLEELEQNQDSLHTWILPMDRALEHFPKLTVSEELALRVTYGQSLRLEQEVKQGQTYRIYHPNHQLLALYTATQTQLIQPKKVFTN